MSDYGRALISRIVDEGDIITATNAGIRANWFEDLTHRKVYHWMGEYFTRYGETPTEDALLAEFPMYRLVDTAEPFAYYIDQFRRQRRRAILVDSVIGANEALDEGNTKTAQEALSRGLQRLGTEVSSLSDSDAIATRKERLAQYDEKRKHRGELTGVTSGYGSLDYVSGGYHPEQFVLFGGQAKQCKSFVLMRSAIAAQDAGYKVLFLSFEMSVFEQLCRYDAICCGLNASHIMRGYLSNREMKQLTRGLRARAGLLPFIVSSDISASTTVSGLAAKMEQHRPDIVFIDGVYLMDNEIGADQGSAQSYTAISRALKRLAQRTKKPVVATTQALPGKMKDGVVTMYSLGWTSAWSQDADLILGVERVTKQMICLRVVGGRNVSPLEMAVSCNFEESLFDEMDAFALEDI